MKEVAELDQELTIEERNLLSVAYKNIIVRGRLFCCSVLAGSRSRDRGRGGTDKGERIMNEY